MLARSLSELIAAYRANDPEAQRELMDRAEPILRRNVRQSMGRGLRSLEESVDLCQSVLLGFHRAVSEGKASFDNDAAMSSYLGQMVRNKLANRADAAGAVKRGAGKVPESLDADDDAAPPISLLLTPSRFLHAQETHKRVADRLTEEEQLIFEGHVLGRTNQEIATTLGKTPNAVRMIWFRARERLVNQGVVEPG